jgi:hypothetical protein
MSTKNFRQRCQSEATRDVIFLFRIRELQWNGHLPPGCWVDDDNQVRLEGDDRDSDEPGLTLVAMRENYGSEYVSESWRVITVFLSREEGEAWGETQRHNYGVKYTHDCQDGKVWQVYGVPAEGELAELLKGT